MERDKLVRSALGFSVVYNLVGGLLFAFPSSTLSQLAGLPSPVSPVYSALVGYFVLLFGGAYAWLALQPTIDRPMVALAAVGKSGVFTLIFVFWLIGHVPGLGVVAAIGDLVLAVIFAHWLLTGASTSAGMTRAKSEPTA
jgi:hypothetical protein